MSQKSIWNRHQNENNERINKGCSFCELSFTLFCSLIYLSIFNPKIFEYLFANNNIQNTELSNETIQNISNDTNIIESNLTVCQWSNWSECDTSCGYGQQFREINNPPCNFLTEFRDCYNDCEPCPLSQWSHWSNCSSSITCSPGVKNRTRTILSNSFCNDNISSSLIENIVCYFNCTQQQIFALKQSLSPGENIISKQSNDLDLTKEVASEESNMTTLISFIVAVSSFFCIMIFTRNKCNKSTNNNLTIKPPGIYKTDSLDSPCERGQLMMMNPLMNFESLKQELIKATTLDKNKQYAEAYTIYVQGSSILINMREKEKSFKQKKIYGDYARTYIKRAEAIAKRYPHKIRSVKKNMDKYPLKIPPLSKIPPRNTVNNANNVKLQHNQSQRTTSLVVNSQKQLPTKPPLQKPPLQKPPLLSETCKSSDESASSSDGDGNDNDNVNTQHYESASSSDGDGDDNNEAIYNSLPTAPTKPITRAMTSKVPYNPPKHHRDKIKKEFPPHKYYS